MSSLLARLTEVVVRIGPLGLIAFGGPAVNIILFRKRFVLSDKPWLDITTFADLFSLSGALPGPGSTQLLFSIALIRGGAIPGIFAFLLFSLPGAIAMFLIALGVSNLPATLPPVVLALLTGLNAAAVGLIFFAALQLTRATSTTPITRLILFFTAAISSCYSAIWLFPVLTIGGGVVTLVADWSGWKNLQSRLRPAKREPESERSDIALEELGARLGETPDVDLERTPSLPKSVYTPDTITRLPTPPPDLQSATLRRRPNAQAAAAPAADPVVVVPEPQTPINLHITIWQSGLVIALFIAIIITVVVLQATLRNPTRALQLFTNLFIAGSILFGGGPVVVPLLQGYTVTPGWVSSQDFLLGYALLSALPGPNFNFAVFLGTLALPQSPVLGAVLAYLGIFTPGLLLKFALLPTYSRFRQHRVVRASLTGLNSAASGLVWTAAYRLWTVGLLTQASGGRSLDKSGYWVSVAGAAFLASESFGVPAPVVIVGGAISGLIFGGAIGAP